MKKTICIFSAYILFFSMIYGLVNLNNISHKNSIKERDLTVCIVDNFTKDLGNGLTHGEVVSEIVKRHFDGKVIDIEVSKEFYKDSFSNFKCDIVNYSQIVPEGKRNAIFELRMNKFIKTYEGILISSAGNKGLSTSQSEWSNLKKTYPNEAILSRTLIVGQFHKEKGSNKGFLTSSYGEEIDLLVNNHNEVLNDFDLEGSSFATPVVTGKIAQLMNQGFSFEKAKEMIQEKKVFTDSNGIEYNLVSR